MSRPTLAIGVGRVWPSPASETGCVLPHTALQRRFPQSECLASAKAVCRVKP